ncbi:hypothetical protein N5923_00395 [Erwiniaceae bacterium BAC15a-03b]|uniref:Uncharacterized protein n=1 Tax=Winslowiella arboricola TaxID=2978220 RepID=A0A9J6PMV2_9GAMM|nr:hypothetical protein [Winslowiella arboricola]MCU5771957.1 hypothetical protein [Winslowiella arboricola]MCU5775956.1 hypothetical protein [Winslowiella arboricola]
MKIISIIMLSILLSGGCTSYNAVQLKPEQIGSQYSYYKTEPPLYVGDIIKYKLKSGDSGQVTIEKIEPNSIVANNGQVIPLSQIASIERKDLSKTKTSALVGGSAVTVAIVVAIGVAVVAIAKGAGGAF